MTVVFSDTAPHNTREIEIATSKTYTAMPVTISDEYQMVI